MCGEIKRMFIRLFNDASSKTPKKAFLIDPLPPARLTPPTTTEAMAVRSKFSPEFGATNAVLAKKEKSGYRSKGARDRVDTKRGPRNRKSRESGRPIVAAERVHNDTDLGAR